MKSFCEDQQGASGEEAPCWLQNETVKTESKRFKNTILALLGFMDCSEGHRMNNKVATVEEWNQVDEFGLIATSAVAFSCCRSPTPDPAPSKLGHMTPWREGFRTLVNIPVSSSLCYLQRFMAVAALLIGSVPVSDVSRSRPLSTYCSGKKLTGLELGNPPSVSRSTSTLSARRYKGLVYAATGPLCPRLNQLPQHLTAFQLMLSVALDSHHCAS